MKRILCLALAVVMLLGMTGCCLKHEWLEPTCEDPKTCSKCGKTEGEALGHDWNAADCDTPKTCARCGKTEGEALGHEEGEWELTGRDAVKAVEVYEKKCTRCGEVIDEKTEPITSLHDDSMFLLTSGEFTDRLAVILPEILGDSLKAEHGELDGDYATIVTLDGEEIAFFLFSDEDENVAGQDDPVYMVVCTAEDAATGAVMLVGMMQALDPSLDLSQALAEAEKVSLMTNQESVVVNGIEYYIGASDEIVMIGAAVG